MYRPTSIKYLLPFLLCLLTACGGDRSYWLGQLEHFEEMSRTDQPLCADSVWPVVRHYDHWWHPSLLRLRAYYMLGSAYRDMGEAPAALHYYQIATEQADTTHADSATCATLFRVYGQMAMIYEQQNMPEEELEALTAFSHHAQKAGDTANYILGLVHTTIPYYMLNDTSKVLQITDKAYRLYQKYGLTEDAAQVYPMAIYISLINGNLLRARRYMDIFEQESGLFDEMGNILSGREQYYENQGLYYAGIHQLDSAEYYFRKLLSFGYKYEAFKGLLTVYRIKEDVDSIAKIALQYENALEEMKANRQAEAIIQSSALYNYERNSNLAEQKAKDATISHYIILMLIFILLMAILIAILIYP